MVCMVVELLVGAAERVWDEWGGWKGIKRLLGDRDEEDEGSVFWSWKGWGDR